MCGDPFGMESPRSDCKKIDILPSPTLTPQGECLLNNQEPMGWARSGIKGAHWDCRKNL